MKRGSRSARAALLGFLLVAGTFLFGACGGGGGAGGSDETVNFGTVDWPEAIAKTNVASTIVDALGYQTKVQELGVPTVFQGLDTGDLDVFVEAWFPTMQTNYDEDDDVESVTKNMEQVAWTGWEPHWMNNRYNMFLLEDPEEAWGGPSHVETLVNNEFPEQFPELYTFFEQMVVTPEIQRELIDGIDNSGLSPEEFALQWLRDNPEVTDNWLAGIEATDGTEGTEALRTYLEQRS